MNSQNLRQKQNKTAGKSDQNLFRLLTTKHIKLPTKQNQSSLFPR